MAKATDTLLEYAPMALGGLLLFSLGAVLGGSTRKKAKARVAGQCTSPVLRAGAAILKKTFAQALALVEQNGGPDVTTCIPKHGAEGVEDTLYRWALYVKHDAEGGTAGYWLAAASVGPSSDGRFSPEVLAVEVSSRAEADQALAGFFAGGLSATQLPI